MPECLRSARRNSRPSGEAARGIEYGCCQCPGARWSNARKWLRSGIAFSMDRWQQRLAQVVMARRALVHRWDRI